MNKRIFDTYFLVPVSVNVAFLGTDIDKLGISAYSKKVMKQNGIDKIGDVIDEKTGLINKEVFAQINDSCTMEVVFSIHLFQYAFHSGIKMSYLMMINALSKTSLANINSNYDNIYRESGHNSRSVSASKMNYANELEMAS